MIHASKILAALLNNTWAIQEEWLRQIYSIIYDREAAADYRALMAEAGQPLDYTYKATKRNNVGIIPIQGPIFPKANMMTELSGATSLEMVIRDVVAMDKDPEIDAIVFPTNTPGGATTGLDEAWSLINNLETPTYMHGTGLVASAGYWLASAVTEISASDLTLVGSIGVMTSAQGKDKDAPGPKELEFVSSVSPRKRLDPETEEGQAEYMEIVNGLAEVFVSHVAEGRSVSPETVTQDFGKGGVLIASKALEAGMIDHICTFESLIARLSGQTEEFSNGDDPMNRDELKAKHPEVFTAVVAEGAAQAKASFDSEILEVNQTNETLKAENVALKEDLSTAEGTIEKSNAVIKERDKQDAINQVKANEANASHIMTEALAGSNIPEALHSKVGVDYQAHVGEDGALDTEAYGAAVTAEVKDWSTSLGSTTTTPVAGFGTGGSESNNNNQDTDDTADAMFASLGYGGDK